MHGDGDPNNVHSYRIRPVSTTCGRAVRVRCAGWDGWGAISPIREEEWKQHAAKSKHEDREETVKVLCRETGLGADVRAPV